MEHIVITILSGIILSLVSGIVGGIIGNRETVKKPICEQLRGSCQALLIEKIDNLTGKVEALTKVINDKHFGIVI